MVDVREAVVGKMERRAVDEIPFESPRPQQMQVLCLGLSRTGTMSLYRALDILGYKAYHYMEVSQPHLPNESHVDAWMEAFKAKMYGNSKPFGRAEFDRILRNYSAVTDAPCCCFPDELISAYPDAKIVLNVRKDKQKWLASMERSFYAIIESRKFRYFRAIAALDFDLLGPLMEGLRYPLLYWTSGDWQNRQRLAQGFDEHYAHVREIAPADRLLEWQVTDGWEPLCKFLDKPIPDQPFPHVNQGDDVQKLFFFLGRLRLATLIIDALKKPMALSAFGGAIVGGWYIYKKYALHS